MISNFITCGLEFVTFRLNSDIYIHVLNFGKTLKLPFISFEENGHILFSEKHLILKKTETQIFLANILIQFGFIVIYAFGCGILWIF